MAEGELEETGNDLKLHTRNYPLLPPFVLHALLHWKPGFFHRRGIFRITNGQEFHNANLWWNAEDFFNFILVEGANPAPPAVPRGRVRRPAGRSGIAPARVVLADQSAPTNPNLRVYTHPLGKSELAWYAPESLVAMAKRDFPRSLSHAPVLLPTSHAAVRARLNRWFEREGILPNVVGEFEDSALLVTFGAAGMGVIPAPTLSHRDLMRRGLKRIGLCTGVVEEHFLICTERKVVHPLIQRLLDAHG